MSLSSIGWSSSMLHSATRAETATILARRYRTAASESVSCERTRARCCASSSSVSCSSVKARPHRATACSRRYRDQRSVGPLSACAEPSTARRSTVAKERRDDIVNPEITTPSQLSEPGLGFVNKRTCTRRQIYHLRSVQSESDYARELSVVHASGRGAEHDPADRSEDPHERDRGKAPRRPGPPS